MTTPIKPPHWSHGLAYAVASSVLGWILYDQFQWIIPAGILVTVGLASATVYYAYPPSQTKIVAGFHALTFPIRWVLTLVVMAVLYYAVITPIGIWFRVSGKSMRKTESDASSNWQTLDLPSDPDSFFRTF